MMQIFVETRFIASLPEMRIINPIKEINCD